MAQGEQGAPGHLLLQAGTAAPLCAGLSAQRDAQKVPKLVLARGRFGTGVSVLGGSCRDAGMGSGRCSSVSLCFPDLTPTRVA